MGRLSRIFGELPGRAGVAAALALACAAPVAEDAPGFTLRDGRPLMGTLLEITLVAESEASGRAAMEECFALGAALEAELSNYDADSAVSRLNAAAGRGPQLVPPHLARILQEAQAAARATGGAFDVTVGPLLALWKKALLRKALPAPGEIAAARDRVGSGRLRLPGGGRAALAAGTQVDLGGIGKGYALDRMGERLAARGIARALLNFGGSSLLARGDGWRVLLRGAGGEIGILSFGGRSVSVSDSLGEFSEIGGRLYSHIVDPRSGQPVAQSALAIAIAESGAQAEAWSTALIAAPGRAALARARAAPGVEVLLWRPGAAPEASPGFHAAASLNFTGLRAAPGGAPVAPDAP